MAKKKGKDGPGLIHRQAQLRGLLGGSRFWFAVWSALAMRRLLKRLLGDHVEVLETITVEPGQAIIVSTKDREPRVISAG